MLINIDEIELFYEISGQGSPIILLHGNGEDHCIFDVLIKQLSEHFTVYAIDSRGHGKSTKTNQLSYQLMAQDIVRFIEKMQMEKPILYGFSDGGIVGLLIACQYPTLLSKLIVSGANTSPNGLKLGWRMLFRFLHFFTRSAQLKLMLCEPNITENDLSQIEIPTLILAGENDMIRKENSRFIEKNIQGSVLKILPKESHSSYVVYSPKLYEVIREFLT